MEDPSEPANVPDPWADAPAWSDGSTGFAQPSESTGEPVSHASATTPGDDRPTCPWCATPTALDAKTCPSCGAALAQRESIGDLVIPGLTAVDPALQDLKDRPLHLAGPSPSHGVASGTIAAAALGGPAGLAIIGGVAALAATEYLGASRGGADGVPVGEVGQASQAVRQAIEKLDRGEELPSAQSTTPRPELEATDGPGIVPATQEDPPDGGE
jgi:hypothetical protein